MTDEHMRQDGTRFPSETSTRVYRYCARIQLQAFGGATVIGADTLKEIRETFALMVWGARGWRDDEYCNVMVYVTCGHPCECDSAMNFHDYPCDMWELGPRGGIRRVYV